MATTAVRPDAAASAKAQRGVTRRSATIGTFRVALVESEEGFAVSCPALPGCHSQGKTRNAALTGIKDAIREWLDVAEEGKGLLRVSEARVTV